MVFSSTTFLFLFLPATLVLYFIVPRKLKNLVLMLTSLVFYAWGEPVYIILMLYSIFLNYSMGLLMESVRRPAAKKQVLTFTVILNLFILGFFKYYGFLMENINALFGLDLKIRTLALPIGISFYTFQALSYVIDLYRGKFPAQKNIVRFAAYITMFPQLIAGPIVRYEDVEKQLTDRTISLAKFGEGALRFTFGLSKKVLLANSAGALFDAIHALNTPVSALSAWLGAIAYTFQIYFDFSGYSDMAIGLGRMFGFHFNENFNLPYISTSISEFWRRWHISLSSWFRDYVYIPLGGNRNHVYRNLGIVFLLTGIWHGAAWNFVLWGIWNGIFILAERAAGVNKKRNKTAPQKTIGWIYSIAVVHFGWILFRAPDLTAAIDMVKNMFGVYDSGNVDFALGWYLDGWVAAVMLVAALFSSSLPRKFVENLKGSLKADIILPINYIGLILVFAFSVMRIVAGTYNPFIYFQF